MEEEKILVGQLNHIPTPMTSESVPITQLFQVVADTMNSAVACLPE